MSIKKLLLVVGLSVLFAGCSTGRFPGEIQSLGSQPSATEMGKRYLLGQGMPKDYEKAFFYFSKAAKNDDPFAQNELAFMYASGKGTQQSYEKAVYWYQKAADHDLASAQYNLGLLYLYGLGTPVNKALAAQWFEKSAAHGFEPARIALQKMRS